MLKENKIKKRLIKSIIDVERAIIYANNQLSELLDEDYIEEESVISSEEELEAEDIGDLIEYRMQLKFMLSIFEEVIEEELLRAFKKKES